jgi:hypothetical protein
LGGTHLSKTKNLGFSDYRLSILQVFTSLPLHLF